MLISIVTKLLPVIRSFLEKIKDKKLTSDELEELAVEAGMAIAAILKQLGLEKKQG